MADVVSPAEVAAMLEEFGLPALWRTVRTDVAYDAFEPLQNAETDTACFAVKFTTEQKGKETLMSDADSQEQPKGFSTYLVSPPTGVTPSKKDLLVIGDRVYQFESLDLLAPAGTLLLITATVFE